MKYAHSIRLTVFSYENENSNALLESFLKFFPFNLEENKIELKKTEAKGANESIITIFEIILAKTNLINRFLDFILTILEKKQKELILTQIESRLDENLDFFMRFDKDEWINSNKLKLTDSGKCFHLKINVAAFPRKREIGLKIIRELFQK
ncbi:MAG TPA: RNA-binding domain-containing protein [Candidatus Nanoarchaeia archaeon]|nr:RNA-binding domain-containing protein [Candidatus Nanoarchaeia archaeon]